MKLTQVFSVEELSHILFPVEGVVDCYIIKNEAGKVTDLCSMYHLPSTIMKHPKYNKLYVTYSYYNVATSVSLTDLIRDLLIIARNKGILFIYHNSHI